MALDRNAILLAQDRPIERVTVPAWGGEVCIRVISGKERDRIDAFIKSKSGRGGLADTNELRQLVVMLSACDESGARLFTEDDLKALGEKSSVALDLVFTAASKLNQLGAEGLDEARADFLSGQKSESGTG